MFQTNSVTAQARQLGYWAMIGDWRYLTTYLDRIRALTAADIQAVARSTFSVDTRTVGHFVPADGGGRPRRPRRVRRRPASTGRSEATGPSPCPARRPRRRRAARCPASRCPTASRSSSRRATRPRRSRSGRAFRRARSRSRADRPGLAAFTAAMLSRGTERRSALGFATALEDVGAGLGASADTLVTTVTGQAQTRDFDLVLDLFAEMLRQPTFPAADFDRLKSEALAGIAQAKTNPDRVAGLAFDRAVYPPGHPLRPETFEESEQTIATITRDDLVDFHRRQYGPDRMVVVVTGDVRPSSPGRARETPRRLAAQPRDPAIRPPDLPLRGGARIDRDPDPGQEPGVDPLGARRRAPPERPRLLRHQVMSLILGGGALTSRLSTVDPRRPGSGLLRLRLLRASLYPGPFRVGLGTNPANARRRSPRSSPRSSAFAGTA